MDKDHISCIWLSNEDGDMQSCEEAGNGRAPEMGRWVGGGHSLACGVPKLTCSSQESGLTCQESLPSILETVNLVLEGFDL